MSFEMVKFFRSYHPRYLSMKKKQFNKKSSKGGGHYLCSAFFFNKCSERLGRRICTHHRELAVLKGRVRLCTNVESSTDGVRKYKAKKHTFGTMITFRIKYFQLNEPGTKNIWAVVFESEQAAMTAEASNTDTIFSVDTDIMDTYGIHPRVIFDCQSTNQGDMLYLRYCDQCHDFHPKCMCCRRQLGRLKKSRELKNNMISNSAMKRSYLDNISQEEVEPVKLRKVRRIKATDVSNIIDQKNNNSSPSSAASLSSSSSSPEPLLLKEDYDNNNINNNNNITTTSGGQSSPVLTAVQDLTAIKQHPMSYPSFIPYNIQYNHQAQYINQASGGQLSPVLTAVQDLTAIKQHPMSYPSFIPYNIQYNHQAQYMNQARHPSPYIISWQSIMPQNAYAHSQSHK